LTNGEDLFEIVHYGRFIMYLSNIYDISHLVDEKMLKCRLFTGANFDIDLLQSSILHGDWTSWVWKDIASKTKHNINCLLVQKLKETNHGINIFENLKIDVLAGPEPENSAPRADPSESYKNLEYIYSFDHFPRRYQTGRCQSCDSIMQILQIFINRVYPEAKDRDKAEDNYSFKDYSANNGQGNGTDYALVVEQMAENGDPRAQYAMGQAYYFGNPNEGIHRDIDRGLDFYRRAAVENGDAAADLGI
jgi:hypothetical protein